MPKKGGYNPGPTTQEKSNGWAVLAALGQAQR